MASRPDSRKNRLARLLAERNPVEVDEALRDELIRLLAPISGDYLRGLLRKAGVRLTPMVEGVRQDDFESLARTLVALAHEYPARPRQVRRLVIRAKDHGKLATLRARDDAVREEKQEMVRWMLVWLENPPVFETWVNLRQVARLAGEGEL